MRLWPKTARGEALLLLGLGLAFWLVVMLGVLALTPAQDSLYQLGFGFGPYVENLLEHGVYATCPGVACDHATRMPLGVWIVALLGLLAHTVRTVALLKAAAFAVLTLASLAMVWRRVRPVQRLAFPVWAAVAAALLLALPVAKHAGRLDYEEGFSIPLLFLLGLITPLAFSSRLGPRQRAAMMLGALAIGSALYLLKASLLPVYGVVLAAALWSGFAARRWLVLGAAVLSLAAPLAWGMHNLQASGRFALGTSWDGENFRRGWDQDSLAVYPAVSLDRIFDSSRIALPDGRQVDIAPKPGREAFRTEWDWNDYNLQQGKAWIAAHPALAARFLLVKACNFLASVEKSPERISAQPQARSGADSVESVAITAWLLAGRLASVLLVVVMARLWLRAPGERPGLVVAVLLLGAYAAPCIVGFNYERHITAALVLVLGCLTALAPLVIEDSGPAPPPAAA
jgi:hypothetical protein